ncbi:Alpha/Beta hydrolase protein [Yarrowia lipolytica]|uniref:Carboxypeptidase n=1 Tax=Yarrowia lipolytica TaxID=4952 RepID=A0A371BYB5_YARLL|nr:Alpha/Beta hydrolase protein [Yarrowia lipolytica]RDW31990.1 Alpha/Beta hydrolase protein [Yarrowia lipolytica]RDW36439.1 Alpha/Beta hydrolase protein [Yarrowia lipolytica]RDW43069.1 Alpha/Beta hydrolase protein [Yarrowia lipolytica]RDW49796.1 Alpha/Beta hydrolase protein [Yarrowia lipolytica]
MRLSIITTALVAASAYAYDVVQNVANPGYSLRVSTEDPSSLGVDIVKQFSGYLDVEKDKKHFFYWFFESRNDPAKDPIVLWLSGGPGCSSMSGLFFENGPSSIGADIKPIKNDFSWNSNASVIFLDQPVGSGFSYSDEPVDTTAAAAIDVYAFLNLFFTSFPQYNKGQSFHITSESYGGHYAHVFAEEILKHSKPERVFDLASIAVGNGIWDSLHQAAGYEPMGCGKGGVPAIFDDNTCKGMQDVLPQVVSEIQQCYNDPQNSNVCQQAVGDYNDAFLGPISQTGLNVYDITKKCDTSVPSGLCYAGMEYSVQYLNKPEVQKALGVHPGITFSSCSGQVNGAFYDQSDEVLPYIKAFPALLEKIPVLIYAGDRDYICNWVGNQYWTGNLTWSGQDEFNKQQLSSWKVEGEASGEIKNHGHFTFLRVFGAGHMVPHDKPKQALAILNRWIGGDVTLADK